MRRSVIYFVFFFFFLLYGCKTATEPGNSIGVDLDGGQDSFDLAALLDTTFYDIVPLETDSACMIGEVSDLFLMVVAFILLIRQPEVFLFLTGRANSFLRYSL